MTYHGEKKKPGAKSKGHGAQRISDRGGATARADKSEIPTGAMDEDWMLQAMPRQLGRLMHEAANGGGGERAVRDEIVAHTRWAFELAEELEGGPGGVLAANALRGKLTDELSRIQGAFEVRCARSRKLAQEFTVQRKTSPAAERRWRAIAGEPPGAARKPGEVAEHRQAVLRAYVGDALLLSRVSDAVKAHQAGDWWAVMDLMNGVQKWCRGGLKALPVRPGDRAVCDEALAVLHQRERDPEWTDAPDEHGYVAAPVDRTAYVPAKQIRYEHTPAEMALTANGLPKVLQDYAVNHIRWTRPPGTAGRPRPNRLDVHLADWLEYVGWRKGPWLGVKVAAARTVDADVRANFTDDELAELEREQHQERLAAARQNKMSGK